MFSAELNKSAFLELQRAYKESNPGLYNTAKRVNNRFKVLRKVSEEEERIVGSQQPEMMVELLEDFSLQAEAELMTGKSGEEADALLECYFAVQGYLRISKLYDDRFVTYAEMSGSEVFLKLFCLDPSYLLQQAGKTTAPAYSSRQHSCRSDITATCWERRKRTTASRFLRPSPPSNWMFGLCRYQRDSGSGAQ